MLDMNMLKARYNEEINDAKVYKDMAESCPEWEKVLMDISHEEEQHANMIEHIIEHI